MNMTLSSVRGWLAVRNLRDFWSWKIAIITTIITVGWILGTLSESKSTEEMRASAMLVLMFPSFIAIGSTVFGICQLQDNSPGEGKFFERSALTGMGLVSMAVPLDLIVIASIVAIFF